MLANLVAQKVVNSRPRLLVRGTNHHPRPALRLEIAVRDSALALAHHRRAVRLLCRGLNRTREHPVPNLLSNRTKLLPDLRASLHVGLSPGTHADRSSVGSQQKVVDRLGLVETHRDITACVHL